MVNTRGSERIDVTADQAPSKRHSGRIWLRIGLGLAAFGAVLLTAAPSDTSIPDPSIRPPEAGELILLAEISDWLLGEQADGEFNVFSERDLVAAIRAEPRSFELFRRGPGADAERRLLTELPYGELISDSAQRHRVDGLLLASIVETESSFDPAAVSSKGALGLMQMMPDTGRRFGAADLLDPAANVSAGARYFSRLMERYDQDVVLALAAYNAGPGNVQRWGGVPPYRETRRFVDRVLTRYVAHCQTMWSGTRAQAPLS